MGLCASSVDPATFLTLDPPDLGETLIGTLHGEKGGPFLTISVADECCGSPQYRMLLNVVGGLPTADVDPQTFQFEVPEGALPGMKLSLNAPNGAAMQVQVPVNVAPGTMLEVPMPAGPSAILIWEGGNGIKMCFTTPASVPVAYLSWCGGGFQEAIVYAAKPRYAGQAPEACVEAGGAMVFAWAQIKCTGQAMMMAHNSMGIYYMTATGFAQVPSIVVNKNGLLGGFKCVSSGTDKQQGLGILSQDGAAFSQSIICAANVDPLMLEYCHCVISRMSSEFQDAYGGGGA